MVLPGGCGELVTLEPHNSESEYSSFAETYATPTASDGKRVSFSNISLIKACANRGKTSNLTEQIIIKELFPTPVASGKLNGGTGGYNKLRSMLARGVISEDEFKSMTAGNGGKLNPGWVEWLHGFPIGWTDCAVSETR